MKLLGVVTGFAWFMVLLSFMGDYEWQLQAWLITVLVVSSIYDVLSSRKHELRIRGRKMPYYREVLK